MHYIYVARQRSQAGAKKKGENMKNWTEKLVKLDACKEAVKWSKQYATLQEAWNVCDQPDWMLYLLNRTQPASTETHHAYVRIACAEARLALLYTNDHRVFTCIETVEKWERGERTKDEVNEAESAAEAAAWDAVTAELAAIDAKIKWHQIGDAKCDAAKAAESAAKAAESAAWVARSAWYKWNAFYPYPVDPEWINGAAIAAEWTSGDAVNAIDSFRIGTAAESVAKAAESAAKAAESAAKAAENVAKDAIRKQCCDIIRKEFPKIKL